MKLHFYLLIRLFTVVNNISKVHTFQWLKNSSIVKNIVKTFFKLKKNSFIGFGSRLIFYIKIIETKYIDVRYIVYPGGLMIDDSENKDFARLRFWKSESKLFYARFIKINKKVNCKLQTFLYVKSLFYSASFSSRDVFPKR